MTETTPDPGPGPSDDPWHIQWLRAQRESMAVDATDAPETDTETDVDANAAADADADADAMVATTTGSDMAATTSAGVASAVAATSRPPLAPLPPDRRRRRAAGLIVGLLALAGVSLAIGLSRGRSRGASATSAAPTVAPAVATASPSVPAAATVATTSAAGTTAAVTVASSAPTTAATTTKPPTTTVAPATTAAPVATTVPPTTSAPAANVLDATPTERLPGGQLWPRGLYVFPKFLMQGTVPNQQVADAIGAKIGAIIGPENVVDETVKDPTVPLVKTVLVRIGPSIIFDTDSDVIRPESVEGWNQWGLFLKQNPAVTVTIIGHTDSRGTAEHNADLAKRRAESAKARMVEVGVDPARIKTVGKGADDPIADNSTSAGMQQNRRIEVAVNDALS